MGFQAEGFDIREDGTVFVHVKDFKFDDTDGMIMVVGEVDGWKNPVVVPIHKFVSNITSN